MASSQSSKQVKPSVFSTMLISKPHKRANHVLRKNLLFILKHPNLAWMRLEGYNIFSKAITLLGGIFLTVLFILIGGELSSDYFFISEAGQIQKYTLSANSYPAILVVLIIGAILTNYLFHRYMDRPSGSAAELNTFMITEKPIDTSLYEIEDERIRYETKLQRVHRKYKRRLLKQLLTHISKDFELKNSRKILVNVAKSLKTKGFQEDIINQVEEVYDWAWSTLDHVHKGSRLTYWNNVGGIDRLIVADQFNQKRLVEINIKAEEIVDELNLLVFANRYSNVIAPLLQQSVKYTHDFDQQCQKITSTLKKGNSHDESFAEAYRVLLSKTLGIQEVLKSTTRQFMRMQEAKEELVKESLKLDLPELEFLANEFVTEEAFKSYLDMIDRLKLSLSKVAQNLRKFDFDNIPKGTPEDLRYITSFYLVLEKLRFLSTWFEDIASYTTVVGGIGYETGGLPSDTKIPENVILKAENLFKNYSTGGGTVYALRGVSFEINKGDFVGIIGTSGSGKTTLLNILAGLDNPDRGAIFIDSVNLQSLNNRQLTTLRRDKIGFIFQFYNLIPLLTNKENVSYPAEIGGNTNNLSQRASKNLESVQLQEFEEQFPNKLSGGQMQRVTIARSLINTPSILFADEPTGDLDSVTGQEIMNLLSSFNKEYGTTVVLVTHDNSLLKYCNKTINMKDGKIIEG